jgi:hypothetical protein
MHDRCSGREKSQTEPGVEEALTASRGPTKMRPPGGKCIAREAMDQRRGGPTTSCLGSEGVSGDRRRIRSFEKGGPWRAADRPRRGSPPEDSEHFHISQESAHPADWLQREVMTRNPVRCCSGVTGPRSAWVIDAQLVNESLVRVGTSRASAASWQGYSTTRASGAPRHGGPAPSWRASIPGQAPREPRN